MFSLLQHQGVRPHVQACPEYVGTVRRPWVAISIHTNTGWTVRSRKVCFADQSQWICQGSIVTIRTLQANGSMRPAITEIVDQARRKGVRPSDGYILWVRRKGLAVVRGHPRRNCGLILLGVPAKQSVFCRDRVVNAAAELIPVVCCGCDVEVVSCAIVVGAVRRWVQRQDFLPDCAEITGGHLVARQYRVAGRRGRVEYVGVIQLLAVCTEVTGQLIGIGNQIVVVARHKLAEPLIVTEEKYLIPLYGSSDAGS